MTISGNIVDLFKGTIYPGVLEIKDGKIAKIHRAGGKLDTYIIPGFVDAHVHIESSMLTPSEFARISVIHGTIATVSDPHEIANVLGVDGVRYMINDGSKVPFRFNFGAPSCVPATDFETSGARIGPEEVKELLSMEDIKFLSEMMNFPGVINKDPVVMSKIKIARELGKPIDGHAPGLRGDDLKKYIGEGITTDHEVLSKDEALEKIKLGMKIQIREGSAAKNFDDLVDLVDMYPQMCMFYSDDKHPDDLIKGHINDMVKKAVERGIDVIKVLRCASLNPVLHYKIDMGLLREGDPADFVIVKDLRSFEILKVFIRGILVAENGDSLVEKVFSEEVNNFKTGPKNPSDFQVKARGNRIKIIGAIDGQIITQSIVDSPKVKDGFYVSDPDRDILKIAVVNRYSDTPPAVGFVKNFGLKKGAIASSVSHDSHNIVAVGVSDEDICSAVNLIIEGKGGLSVVSDSIKEFLPLPVAGLMSNKDGFKVAEIYSRIEKVAKDLGAKLSSPFMTLSFMALPVIPSLKITDKGLFDVETFSFTPLEA